MRLAALLAAVLFLACACGREPLEAGVAAKVNGVPVALSAVEFVHAQGPSSETATAPGDMLSALRTEYAQALAALLAQELVVQDLARRGLDVDEAELKKAETALRSGYPGNTFEDTLAEEGLDLEAWRRRVKARLAMDKFTTLVLRPQVSVSFEEVQAYFKEHGQEFAQPARVQFLCVESKSSQVLEAALAAAAKASNPADVLTVFDEVSVQAQASAQDKLPAPWREALKNLAPGQASPIRPGGLGFQAFVLLERTQPRAEGLVRSYPLVEKRVVEGKLGQAFEQWLRQALAQARIEVNPALLPEKVGFW